MVDEDVEIMRVANEYVRNNMKGLVNKFVGGSISQAQRSVAMFMAGSPGAGKTEVSKLIIEQFPDGKQVVRIDPDDIRAEIPGYCGSNSGLLQHASTLVVDRILNHCFDKNKHFILDGTFSSIDKARKNIERAISHNREVVVIYIFQRPEVAWEFVKAGEAKDGRRITKEQFIKGFVGARECVNMLKDEFKEKVEVWFIQKDNDNKSQNIQFNVNGLDGYLPKVYTQQDIENII